MIVKAPVMTMAAVAVTTFATMAATTTTRKLQHVSDIFLNNIIPNIPQSGEYVALLGNIGDPSSKIYRDFVELMSYKYRKVFLIAGPLEIRTIKWVSHMSTIAKSCENVFFMNEHAHISDGHTILGVTWAPIFNLTPLGVHEYHRKRQWLKRMITNAHSDKPVIVLSDRPPLGDQLLPVGGVDITHLLRNNVHYWLHGGYCNRQLQIRNAILKCNGNECNCCGRSSGDGSRSSGDGISSDNDNDRSISDGSGDGIDNVDKIKDFIEFGNSRHLIFA